MVQAKTGTLNEVDGLAGFVHTPTGEDLTFAVIINGALPNAIDLADQVAMPWPSTARASRWTSSVLARREPPGPVTSGPVP